MGSILKTKLNLVCSETINITITHLLSHILATLQVVVTVWKNLRLHDGHDAMLRGRGTAGEDVKQWMEDNMTANRVLSCVTAVCVTSLH